MQISVSIFKAYDIRGVVPVNVDETMAALLAPWPCVKARPPWPLAVMGG